MRGAIIALLLLAAAVLSVPGRAGREAARPRARWRLPRVRRRSKPRQVAQVLVDVAARLRAGATVADAWHRSLPTPAPPWAAPVLAELGLPPSAAAGKVSADDQCDVDAAIAACRLANRTGGPLADVLDVVVSGIGEARAARQLRKVALAGPHATARLLAWLPLAGIGLGIALGADPVAVLLGGGWGTASLVVGVVLFAAGWRWVQLLVNQAARAGQ